MNLCEAMAEQAWKQSFEKRLTLRPKRHKYRAGTQLLTYLKKPGTLAAITWICNELKMTMEFILGLAMHSKYAMNLFESFTCWKHIKTHKNTNLDSNHCSPLIWHRQLKTFFSDDIEHLSCLFNIIAAADLATQGVYHGLTLIPAWISNYNHYKV